MGRRRPQGYRQGMPTTAQSLPHQETFAKFRELTANIPVAMLTTRRADGLLHSRPMGTREVESEGVLWFFTADDSAKVEEIYYDQTVNVSYADPAAQIYLSVAGKATISRDRERMRALWTPLLKTWFPQGVDDPKLALLRIDIQAIDYWEGDGKLVSLFKMAKSALTSTPSKLGQHGRIAPAGR